MVQRFRHKLGHDVHILTRGIKMKDVLTDILAKSTGRNRDELAKDIDVSRAERAKGEATGDPTAPPRDAPYPQRPSPLSVPG